MGSIIVVLNYKLQLQDLSDLIIICQESYNIISYALNNSTTYWKFSDYETFMPVVKNLEKYSRLKYLFYHNLSEMKDNIDTTELGRIIKGNNDF